MALLKKANQKLTEKLIKSTYDKLPIRPFEDIEPTKRNLFVAFVSCGVMSVYFGSKYLNDKFISREYLFTEEYKLSCTQLIITGCLKFGFQFQDLKPLYEYIDRYFLDITEVIEDAKFKEKV